MHPLHFFRCCCCRFPHKMFAMVPLSGCCKRSCVHNHSKHFIRWIKSVITHAIFMEEARAFGLAIGYAQQSLNHTDSELISCSLLWELFSSYSTEYKFVPRPSIIPPGPTFLSRFYTTKVCFDLHDEMFPETPRRTTMMHI